MSLVVTVCNARISRLVGICALSLCVAAKPVTTKPSASGDSRGALSGPCAQSALYSIDFGSVGFGQAPAGWLDLVNERPSRNWAVDGKGFLRPMLKNYFGLLAYEGALSNDAPAKAVSQGAITATFKKTEDPDVFFGLAARIQDRDNYYAARFSGDSPLELFKVVQGKPELIASCISLKRYRYPDEWKLTLGVRGDLTTAILKDDKGLELVRVDGKDDTFKGGALGLNCTTFAAAKSVQIESIDPYTPKRTPDEIEKRNVESAASFPSYPIAKPIEQFESLNTPFDKLADAYDVIVAGGGTGGAAAAIQAARLGAKVLLLEETDWLGGQMSAAGVSAMDEGGYRGIRLVRERGIYREFHESMAAYYYTLDKDPFRGDRSYGDPNTNAGYEPRIALAGLYAQIADARKSGIREGEAPAEPRLAGRLALPTNGAERVTSTLDVSLHSRVLSVSKSGNTVDAVTIEVTDAQGKHDKQIKSKVLIDATEYGDVIPLTGARYRVGNVTSDHLDLQAPVQDYTWVAVIREYPQGVPDKLKIREAPPGYGSGKQPFSKYKLWGSMVWGKEARQAGADAFQYQVYFGYRSVPDTASPMHGEASEHRHTLTSINGGNDYPVTVATIENPEQRKRDARDGIYKTLGVIYYLQHELGANWSVAEDQGYDTPANRATMRELGIRADLMDVACNLPQMPYVRESRRIMGVKTLLAADLSRGDDAKLFPTSVAMGDYGIDLHNTADALEPDLDSPNRKPSGGGPFQIPFETFIPEKIDGFLAAEKNISQSRLVSGASRMQPSTMLMGQAAGTIAALAVKLNKQPRELNPMLAQAELLKSGSSLIQRWYEDVPWGTPIWRATQLLSLYQVMDRPGDIDRHATSPGEIRRWGVDKPLSQQQLSSAIARLRELKGQGAKTQAKLAGKGPVSAAELSNLLSSINSSWVAAMKATTIANPASVSAGEFAGIAERILLLKEKP